MATPIHPPEDSRRANRIALGERGGDVPFKAGSRLVTRLETAVEGVHFDLGVLSPAEIGHRALAAAMSDLAAMGAEPIYAHVSIGARQETSEPFLFELESGLAALAKRFKFPVVRGGLYPSPTALIVQVTLFGSRGDTDWGPGGAKPGDRLYVTGGLGGALAAMTVLKRLGRHELRGRERLLVKHTRPEPRTAAARWLRSLEGRASAVRPSAVIDIQDGLATELFRLAKASDVGATVDVARLPVDAETKETAGLIRGNVDVWAVYGPEDYELLVAIPEKQVAAFEKAARTAKTPFTAIGAVVPKKEHLTVVNREGERVRLEPRLWHQFVRRFGKSFD